MGTSPDVSDSDKAYLARTVQQSGQFHLDTQPYLSVVVPIYNEVDNVKPFHLSLMPVLRELDIPWEVIYVDDGSRDGSPQLLASLIQGDERARLVALRRNFGQTAAMSAGIRHSQGRVIVTMDGDCQNDPRDIPRLLKKIDEGYDVVSGWRAKRQDARILRKFPSKVANQLISKVTGVNLHDYGCTLKAYRREVLDEIRLYGEMHRFIPAYAAMVGASIVEIPVRHHPRERGKSKYGISRVFRVALDLLTVKFLSSYATKPLYLFGRVALAIFALAFVLAVVMVEQRVVSGFYFVNSPLLILDAVLLIIGSQTILLGLLAELIMRTYHESQRKPTYIVRNLVGFAEPTVMGRVEEPVRGESIPLERKRERPLAV